MQYIAKDTHSLIEALCHLSPKSSKNTLKSWIKEGRVAIDETTTTNPSTLVYANQKVTVHSKKKILLGKVPIIYEDRDLIAINKPSGLLTVSTAFEKEETAYALLKAHFYPRQVFVVHRLDQDTSGVMLFALNEETQLRLKEIFEVHNIERSYTAIVEGALTPPQGTWKSFQYEDANYFVHETKDETKGKLAITHFRTIHKNSRYSLLELTLETGRKNQIRVHCSAAGHPVIGDKKYGSLLNPLKRLCLHAHVLRFIHPFTKKKMNFEVPVPNEFYKLIPN